MEEHTHIMEKAKSVKRNNNNDEKVRKKKTAVCDFSRHLAFLVIIMYTASEY